MSISLRNLFTSQSFLFFFIIITILEVVGYFTHDNNYYFDQRYITQSTDSIVNEISTDTPFWKYKPLTKIRSTGIYTSFIEAKLEYDCIFKTNKYGFVNTGKFNGIADFLILGDSLTEGHGGCPWLTEETIDLEPNLKNIKILNGGFMSAGIRKFEQVLYYARNVAKVKKLIIIAISNDFKRDGPSKWHVDRDCYGRQVCSSVDYFYFRKFSTSIAKLKAESKQRRKERGPNILSEFSRYSFTIRTIINYKKIFSNYLFAENVEKIKSREKSFQKNFNALSRIHELYPDLSIILVPTRDEVGMFGKKNKDSQFIEKHLKKENIKFNWCDLKGNDFLPLDGHPNKVGYKKMFQCMVNEIKKYEKN